MNKIDLRCIFVPNWQVTCQGLQGQKSWKWGGAEPSDEIGCVRRGLSRSTRWFGFADDSPAQEASAGDEVWGYQGPVPSALMRGVPFQQMGSH